MTAPERRYPRSPGPISDQTWEAIRAEFTLPSLAQVRRRLFELMEDPEPVMRQLVRVFIDDGTEPAPWTSSRKAAPLCGEPWKPWAGRSSPTRFPGGGPL